MSTTVAPRTRASLSCAIGGKFSFGGSSSGGDGGGEYCGSVMSKFTTTMSVAEHREPAGDPGGDGGAEVEVGFAIASSTLATSLEMRGFSIGPVAPVVVPSARALNVSLGAAVFLVLTLVPIILSRHTSTRSTLVSVWTGQAMGSGLVIGGMVRPSVIKGALSPQQFDLTLWLLFVRLHLTPTHP